MIKRLLTGLGLIVLGTIAAPVAVLAFPQPLFSHQVSVGHLSLHSDAPFDPARGRAILTEVAARLATSPLNDGTPHAIYVANAEWRRRLVFLVAGGAAGVNYAPITNNVFLRRSDVDGDRVFGASGRAAAPPRTLTYYAAHEIAHSLTSERLGPGRAWNRGLPQWVREGYADYVGLGGRVDVDALYRRYRVGDPELDFAKSHTYARFRLLTAYLLGREGWSVDQLLATSLTQAEVEARMDTGMAGRAPNHDRTNHRPELKPARRGSV